MTQSAETVVTRWNSNLEQAERENKILWLFLAPEHEHDAWEWFSSTQKLLVEAGLKDSFLFCPMDSLVAPELDQAAQYIMQSARLPAGWPVNLLVHPVTKKAIVGFHMMMAADLLKFLGDLAREWKRSPKSLELFAEKSTGAAVLGDPQRLAQKVEEGTPLSLEDLNTFFITPLIQSLDPKTGLLGAGDKLNLFTGAYHAMAVSSADEMFRLSQACLTRLFLSAHADTLDALVWSSQDDKRLVARLADQIAVLSVITTIVRKTPNPFLMEVGAELVSSILKRFVKLDQVGNFSELKSFVEYSASAFRLSTSDLLEALDSGERLVAQKFFGLTAEPKLPFLQTTVIDLAQQLNMEPMDVKLALLTIKKKLRAFRQSRLKVMAAHSASPIHEDSFSGSQVTSFTAVSLAKHHALKISAANMLAFRLYSSVAEICSVLKLDLSLDSEFGALKSYVTALVNKGEDLGAGHDETSRSAAYEIEQAIVAIEFAKERAQDTAGSFDDWKNLSETVMKAAYLDLNSEWGFLDTRSNGVDHLGPSLMSRQLELLSRAMRVPQLKAFLNPHIHYACEEGLENLRLLKRLGVHVGHFLAALTELIGSAPSKRELSSFASENR